MLFSGIGDEDVEFSELFDRFGNRILAELLVTDIATDEQRLCALGFDQFLRLLGIARLVAVDDGDVRALSGVEDGGCPSDPGIPTGDKGSFSF